MLASLGKTRVTVLPAENSIAFATTALDLYRRTELFVIARPEIDPSDLLPGVELVEAPFPPMSDASGWLSPQHQPHFSDDPAQIVFSSGTEGVPKAILLSHRNLADVVERLNTVMGLTGEVREYIGVPVTYSFGLGRLRAVAAVNGQAFLPERFDPAQIGRMLAAGEINAISAVPSLWRVLLSEPDVIGPAGPRLRWIEIGSQYMAPEEKTALRQLFPDARIVQHYGLTEASRSTFLDISAVQNDAALASVGSATGRVEIRITGTGAIAIRGRHVALGKLGPDGGIEPLADEDGWLVTRDQGRLENGLLYFEGRLDDQINVSGVKLAAETLERGVATLVPAAEGRFAMAPVPDPLRGNAVLLALEEGPDGGLAPLVEAAAKRVLQRHGVQPGGVLRVRTVSELPRTQTGKVQRKRLADIAPIRGDGADPAPSPEAGGGVFDAAQERVRTVWAQVLGSSASSPNQTFYDLGGDSLSALQIGLMMEREGFASTAVTATLEGRSLATVAQIAEHPPGGASKTGAPAMTSITDGLPTATAQAWALNLARGFMVFWVLFNHWSPAILQPLGIQAEVERVLAIFIRLGTPGFAVVFGIGIGLFLLPRYATNPDAVRWRFRSSFYLVFLGMILTAIVALMLDYSAGGIGGQEIGHAFYNVLAYYAVALLSAPLWLPLLDKMRGSLLTLAVVALAAWALSKVSFAVIGVEPLDNALDWARLMLVAKYNIFKMSALALSGVAIGLWLGAQSLTPEMNRRASRILLGFGSVLTLAFIFAMREALGSGAFIDREAAVFDQLAGFLMYIAFSAALLGGFLMLMERWAVMGRTPRQLLQIAIVMGGLALPIFIFHRLVIPVKDLLLQASLPVSIAFSLPMGLFVIMMFYGFWRLHRMYFSR